MRQRRRRTVITIAALMSVLIAFAACGSDSPASSGGESQIRDAGGQFGLQEDRLITNASGIYTMDDLVAVGFKKSKQFSTETLPNATDVWYGFFNQKDIEVRVYASHEDALEFGVEPAETAIDKKPGQTDYLIPVVNRYPAFAVVGNMVMLCERQLSTCQDLIAELP